MSKTNRNENNKKDDFSNQRAEKIASGIPARSAGLLLCLFISLAAAFSLTGPLRAQAGTGSSKTKVIKTTTDESFAIQSAKLAKKNPGLTVKTTGKARPYSSARLIVGLKSGKKVDFSKWVPEGFGTADVLIVADDTLYITDMKYGVGCLVSAAGEDGTGNSQLKCYALGALDTFGDLYDIRRIRLTIFQPRRENIDTFELSKTDLLRWADEILAPVAKLAYEGQGEFKAGNHCQFCRVKATCRKRAESAMELAKYEFTEPVLLDENEIAEILPKVDSLVKWAEDIKTYALNQALAGVRYPGFKLVAGRSNRKYADEAAVARVVSDAGYDPWDKKLAGITEMTRRLGKKRFEELLKDFLIKPEGKPVLVPQEDDRQEINTAQNDFEPV